MGVTLHRARPAHAIAATVTVSSTGIVTPSLDSLLQQPLGLAPTVQRLPIFGLGCAGGVIGLGRAAALAFQIEGESALADPDPGPFVRFWLYDHPPLAERLRFCLDYDPWKAGQSPRYVR